jgi:hypothetical protein
MRNPVLKRELERLRRLRAAWALFLTDAGTGRDGADRAIAALDAQLDDVAADARAPRYSHYLRSPCSQAGSAMRRNSSPFDYDGCQYPSPRRKA